MKNLQDMIAVMNKCNNGKRIERRLHGSDIWEPTSNPDWNWAKFDFREAQKEEKEKPIVGYITKNEFGKLSLTKVAYETMERNKVYMVKIIKQ